MKIRKNRIYPTLVIFLLLLTCLSVMFIDRHNPISIFASIFFGFGFLLYLGNTLGIVNFKDDLEYDENSLKKCRCMDKK